MAALRATIRTDRKRMNSDGRVTRLSDRVLNTHADTWNTFTETELHADGSGWVTVRQNGDTIARLRWSPEDATAPTVEVFAINNEHRAARHDGALHMDADA